MEIQSSGKALDFCQWSGTSLETSDVTLVWMMENKLKPTKTSFVEEQINHIGYIQYT